MTDDRIDPASATTTTDLAQLIKRLRLQAGMTREELAEKSGLSRTTIFAIESEKDPRLPRRDNLLRILDACGVDKNAQRDWLAARDRIFAAKSEDSPPTVEDRTTVPEEQPPDGIPPSPEPAAAVPRARSFGRWWAVGGAALLIAAATSSFFLLRSTPPEVEMHCEPAGCVAPGKELTVVGSLSGEVPPGHEVRLLIRVESSGRWYLGPAVAGDRVDTPGTWSRSFPIGNPVPQPKDRYFSICSYVLPSSSLGALTDLLVARSGDGVTPEELPPDRDELACVKAVRLRDT
jgi:transcriptional regulator with XRE-family HTH domain